MSIVHVSKEQREVLFSGRVQGVGFRYTTQGIARRYPVTGFVQNLPDGRVRLVVEGTPADLDSLIDELETTMGRWIQAAHVDRHEPTGTFDSFDIRY